MMAMALTAAACDGSLATFTSPHDPTHVILNADTGILDRYVQPGKMVHAALLHLMLEAVTTDLVSPSA
jgi:hypothetical protein